jgi:hypothetical protein
MSTRSTGQVAALLGLTEPRLNDLLRRGKILGAPPCVAGRRIWSERHITAAAAALGIATATVEAELERIPANAEEVPRG